MRQARPPPAGVELRGKRGSGIRIRWMVKGARKHEVLDLPHTPEGIAEAAARRNARARAARDSKGLIFGPHTPSEAVADMAAYYAGLFHSARKRGGEDGYHLTREDENALVARAEGRCMVTGIAFHLERNGAWRAPYAPSLDRISSAGQYTRDNTRLVCVAANMAMNEWGEQVLAELAKGYVRTVVLAQDW